VISPDLIQQCIRRDRIAQSKLYKACYGHLMPVCMRYARCEDDAKEYLNLGFYKILTRLKKYKPQVPFLAWAKRVLIHTIIDEMRRNKLYRKHLTLNGSTVREDEGEGERPFDEQAVSAEDIYRYIQNLPPVTGSVFNLYAIDGYKHREIAKLLKISEGTSKWHYAEARKRLILMIPKQDLPVRYLEKIPER
jgi:RNA polymerase sigma factor (sigma-70 family)